MAGVGPTAAPQSAQRANRFSRPCEGAAFHFRKKYMMRRQSLLIASAFLGLFAGTAHAHSLYAQSGMWAVYRQSSKACYADLIDYTKPQGYGPNL